MTTKQERSAAGSVLGKRSYQSRLKRLGIERLREIARENGKKGGRPKKAQVTTCLAAAFLLASSIFGSDLADHSRRDKAGKWHYAVRAQKVLQFPAGVILLGTTAQDGEAPYVIEFEGVIALGETAADEYPVERAAATAYQAAPNPANVYVNIEAPRRFAERQYLAIRRCGDFSRNDGPVCR